MVLFVKHIGFSVRLTRFVSTLLKHEGFVTHSRFQELFSSSSEAFSLFDSACSLSKLALETLELILRSSISSTNRFFPLDNSTHDVVK